MSKKKWFFKRGNARVSWDTAPEWAQWFAVDSNGAGHWYRNEPKAIKHLYFTTNLYQAACNVGKPCEDWRDLIFQRPQSLSNAVSDEGSIPRRLITNAEWQAIRTVLPGARYIAKDYSGLVHAYTEKVKILQDSFTPGWVYGNRRLSYDNHVRLHFLRDRFKDIDWRESLIEYGGEDA